MRTIPSSITTLLASGQGIESMILLEVAWNQTGGSVTYTDKTIFSGSSVVYEGAIISVGTFDESQRSDSSGSSGSLSVVLDDRGGRLKSIFDHNDIHLVKAKVYQGFFDTVTGQILDQFLLHAGVISTPIVWDEGAQTLGFDIVTRLNGQEVGWSPELGNYDTIPYELIGKPWPLVFGDVAHVPAIRLQNVPTAFTTEPFSIPDTNISSQIALLYLLWQDAIWATMYYSAQASDAADGAGLFDQQQAVLDDENVKKYTQMQADCQEQIQQLSTVLANQSVYAKGQVGLIPSVDVLQPYTGYVRVGNNIMRATISRGGGVLETQPVALPGSGAMDYLKHGMEFYPAGTQVAIAGDYPISNVVSIVPGNVVDVWAMNSVNGIKQLVRVPPGYYSVQTEAIGQGMEATYVVLKQPLETVDLVENLKVQTWENNFGKYAPTHLINQVEWESDLYVTFESSVGPNAVDIMIWIITNFTNNGYDSASFAAVRAAVDGMPMNFMRAEMPDAFTFLTEIAYQARCCIYLRDDVFYLLFWPAQPTPVDTITEDDIEVGSLKVTTTPTESLVTKYIGTFQPDYSPFFSQPVQMILRYRVPQYGVHEEQHDFYCYNSFYAAEHAATFWMIRKSQTWKILSAKLLLNKINLEVFDAVTLHFASPYVASGDVVGVITKADYNADEKVIDVEIWTPVLLGTMAANTFAWPASMVERDVWPQYRDLSAGGGQSLSSPQLPPSNSSTPEIGTIPRGFFGGLTATRLNWSSGDPVPESNPPADPVQRRGLPTGPSAKRRPDPEDYKFKPVPNVDPVFPSGAFPGLVGDKVGPNETNSNLIDYEVQVYTRGLQKRPTKMKVGQLDCDQEDTCPKNSWTIVMVNGAGKRPDHATITYDDKGNPVPPEKPSTSALKVEATMQVPIWLT